MTRAQIEAEFDKMFMPPKDSSFGPVIRSGDAILFAEHIAKLEREECTCAIRCKGLIQLEQTNWNPPPYRSGK